MTKTQVCTDTQSSAQTTAVDLYKQLNYNWSMMYSVLPARCSHLSLPRLQSKISSSLIQNVKKFVYDIASTRSLNRKTHWRPAMGMCHGRCDSRTSSKHHVWLNSHFHEWDVRRKALIISLGWRPHPLVQEPAGKAFRRRMFRPLPQHYSRQQQSISILYTQQLIVNLDWFTQLDSVPKQH